MSRKEIAKGSIPAPHRHGIASLVDPGLPVNVPDLDAALIRQFYQTFG